MTSFLSPLIISQPFIHINSFSPKTIDRLGLACSKLERSRRAAIAAIEPDDGFSIEEAQRLIQAYAQLDDRGKYVPFCAAVIYRLQQCLP
jgi:hypothetical protein